MNSRIFFSRSTTMAKVDVYKRQFLGFLAMHGEPAGIDQHLALGLEGIAFDAGDPGGDQIFGSREKDREEAFDDEIVEFLFQLCLLYTSRCV